MPHFARLITQIPKIRGHRFSLEVIWVICLLICVLKYTKVFYTLAILQDKLREAISPSCHAELVSFVRLNLFHSVATGVATLQIISGSVMTPVTTPNLCQAELVSASLRDSETILK